MNDNIIMQISKCVEQATFYKERLMHQEFQYYKGQLVGLGLACMSLGFTDEGQIAKRLASKYPFEGKKPTDWNKIVTNNQA